MGYVQSITGDPINPNPFSYSQLTLSSDIVLEWPSADSDTPYPATSWIDIDATTDSPQNFIANLPDATQSGLGSEIVFNNVGSFFITIADATGVVQAIIGPGFTQRVWTYGNSTPAGNWRVANIGSGTSGANAAALAGYGLAALSNQLSQSMPTVSYGVNTTLVVGVRANMVIWTGGSGTFTLPSAASAGDNWFTIIKNAGSGTLTVASSNNVDGVASVTATPEVGFIVGCNGATFYTIGKTSVSANALSQLNKSVAGSSDVTLTSTEAAYNVINLTGTITANINTIVPATLMEWIFFNNTSGSFALTVKTPSGMGVAITQGTRNLLYCDGTNVQRQDAVTGGTVTSITAGTGLTGGAITGSGTIAINTTTVTGGSYGDVSNYPSFTVNAQGQLTAAVTLPIQASVQPFLAGGLVNKFHNPRIDIFQRGASGSIASGTQAITADRWYAHATGATLTWGTGFNGTLQANILNLACTTGLTDVYLFQRIESTDSMVLGTQQVTFQARIYNTTGASITPTLTLSYPTATDNWAASTVFLSAQALQACANSAATTVSYTFACPANVSAGMAALIDFGAGLNHASGGGVQLQITELDIRATPGLSTGLNSTPPPVEIRPIALEEMICERYAKVINQMTLGLVGWGWSSNTANSFEVFIPLKNKMRAVGSVTLPAAANFQFNFINAVTITTSAGNDSTQDYVSLSGTVASGVSANQGGALRWQNATGNQIVISADL